MFSITGLLSSKHIYFLTEVLIGKFHGQGKTINLTKVIGLQGLLTRSDAKELNPKLPGKFHSIVNQSDLSSTYVN